MSIQRQNPATKHARNKKTADMLRFFYFHLGAKAPGAVQDQIFTLFMYWLNGNSEKRFHKI